MARLYYSISEVSRLIDEEQHILRYWEKEFSQLSPRKRTGGNRAYSERDLAILKIIKRLLREEMLSLRGAREKLRAMLEDHEPDELFPDDISENPKPEPAAEVATESGDDDLGAIFRELARIKRTLESV
ncbi:MAG: MerR family transcriptional regulator [Candidatus Kapaibacterium sp.]